MACEEPRKAYRAAHQGGPLTFTRPISGNAGLDYETFNIPCGNCILCQAEKARQWGVRIFHESQSHNENCFITLTYSDENLPAHSSLDYTHTKLFTKRLKEHFRRRDQVLRYYLAGEYGDQTKRPHYHACIFGHAFTQQRRLLRTAPTVLWTSDLLEEIWGHGQVSVGVLNFQTAKYTASYITKKLRSKQQYVRIDEATGELVPLEQPRAFMSRNIGRAWWDQYRHQVSAHDHVIIDGKPQKPPKAYDRWLGEVNELPLEMIKDQRFQKGLEKPRETEIQRRARARNAHAHAEGRRKKL